MINYLTHYTFIGYDESKRPSEQPAPLTGGGVATKTARVMETLKKAYPSAAAVTTCEDIDAEFVLVEPLYFTMEQPHPPMELVKQLANVKARKILYCSEKSIFRMHPKLRNALIDACDIVTVNCAFMRNIFPYLGINIPLVTLCDPIPDHVFFNPDPLQKKPQLLAMGYIIWHKHVEGIIEVFKRLEGVVERTYIGSNRLWSNVPVSQHSQQLQEELYKHTDTVIEDAGRSQIAHEMQNSQFGLWIAYHDTFAFSVHEMLMSGVLLVTANHGQAHHFPVWKASGVKAQVEALKHLAARPTEELAAESAKVSHMMTKQACYATFHRQLQTIFQEIV